MTPVCTTRRSSNLCVSDARHINVVRRLSLERYAHTPCGSVRKDTTCPSHQFYVAHRKPCNENVPLALPSITFGHKPFGRRRRGGGRPLWPSGWNKTAPPAGQARKRWSVTSTCAMLNPRSEEHNSEPQTIMRNSNDRLRRKKK